eukprot:c46144_g1_i1 orf=1-150(-)
MLNHKALLNLEYYAMFQGKAKLEDSIPGMSYVITKFCEENMHVIWLMRFR